jgi:DNA-binding NarL/FixJ family response regulator
MAPPVKILLVEGHPTVREALATRLCRDSRVRVLAATGRLFAAEKLAAELVPDVVLCDPRSVDSAPAAVVRAFAGSGCPVVVLTSTVHNGEEACLKGAGAAAVLLKGCSVNAVCTALAAAAASPGSYAPGEPLSARR